MSHRWRENDAPGSVKKPPGARASTSFLAPTPSEAAENSSLARNPSPAAWSKTVDAKQIEAAITQ